MLTLRNRLYSIQTRLMLVVASLLLSACQTPLLNSSQQESNPFQFSNMLASAENCIDQQKNKIQCYQQAFPKRCRNFAKELESQQATTRAMLNNCVSACQQASIASRSFGACATTL